MTNRGGPQRPLSLASCETKFQDNVAGLLPAGAAAQAKQAVARLDQLPDPGAVLRPLECTPEPPKSQANAEESYVPAFDLLIKNVRVVTPDEASSASQDIAVTDGTVAAVGPGLPAGDAATVIDGHGRYAFPGVVDAHQHWGIYNPLEADTDTESRACAQGGVTTAMTYMRTGQYYLNKGGPYAEFFPKVLAAASGRAYVDYAFHLAPMMSSHIDEIPC